MAEDAQQQKRVVGWFLRNWEWVVTLGCAAGAFLLYRDYGIGWDSEIHARYGERVLDYFLGGMRNPEQTQFVNLHLYGWLFDLPSAALHRLLGLDKHTLRGLLSALFAVATVPAVAGIARRIGGERLAVFSCTALILTPQFFGQAFINPKDIPLACTVAWAVLAICRLTEDPGWKNVLGLAVAFGAVLSMRVGAVFVFVFLAAAGLWRVLPAAVEGQWRRMIPTRPAGLAFKAGAALLLTWGLVVSAWPYAHLHPLLNPYEAMREAAAFSHVFSVLFRGEYFAGDALPAAYLPTYLALNYQPVLLGLILLGGVGALTACGRHWRGRPAAAQFLVLFWIAFPVGYVLVRRPNIYDGARHFTFLLPAFAIIGGQGISLVADFCRHLGGRVVERAGLASLALLAVLPLVRWHPYQYAYLNLLAGDRATLHHRFETDYWKTSYKAAAEWLNEQQALSLRPLRVVVAATDMSRTCLEHFLDPRITVQLTMDHVTNQVLPEEADYYVGTTRYQLDENFNRSPVAWEERCDGVLLCVIRSNRHIAVR